MNDQDEWDGLRHLFETYGLKLKYDAIECTVLYLSVGENELGFEYLMLFLFETGAVLSESDRSLALALAERLKMDRNEWSDERFWSKFTELCERTG